MNTRTVCQPSQWVSVYFFWQLQKQETLDITHHSQSYTTFDDSCKIWDYNVHQVCVSYYMDFIPIIFPPQYSFQNLNYVTAMQPSLLQMDSSHWVFAPNDDDDYPLPAPEASQWQRERRAAAFWDVRPSVRCPMIGRKQTCYWPAPSE